jgi:hypothetical protein
MPFFADFFGKNILKIITLVPDLSQYENINVRTKEMAGKSGTKK